MSAKKIWHKITFLGLEEHEEFEQREVVLLNKMVAMASAVMFFLIPIEVVINGWKMVPFEFAMGLLCLFSLLLTYKRKFMAAKVYFFFVAIAVIGFMGILVGKGTNNELFMLPVFIFPMILFNNLKTVLILCSFAFVSFIAVITLQNTVLPVVDISDEIRGSFRYVFLVVIFILVFFEIYYFKRINYKFQDLISKKSKEISEQKKEIIDSINYAKRIQEAILPSKSQVEKLLQDAFVLYKPKDIVAGDFYWVEEKNDLVIFAAADCTGHGVPGAMVSVVCENALHKSISEFDLTIPGEILDKTKELVTEKFITSDEDVKDGMDIALCTLNRKSNELKFAGAYNPLWILRNGSDEIEEIKATKQAVGKTHDTKPFQTHSMLLNKGDIIYVFSDGYADQFGGEKGKKLKYKPFRKMLVENANKTMSEQSNLINQGFESWRGDFEQIDDVCIIGVRI